MAILKTHYNSLNSEENDGVWSGCTSDRTSEGLELISKASSTNPSIVMIYDQAGSTGSMEDKTTEASSTTGSTFNIFNSNEDAIRVSVDVDSVKGIDISISIGAVWAGTPVIKASYRNNLGEIITLDATILGSFSDTGIINIAHDEIMMSDIMSLPKNSNPTAEFEKFIDYQISGISSITVSPTAQWLRVHLGDSTEHIWHNYTGLMQTGGVYAQETQDIVIAPIKGDLTLFGFDKKVAKIHCKVYRGTSSNTATTKRVYSTDDGFSDLSVEDVVQSETSGGLFNDQGQPVFSEGSFLELTDIINPPSDWVQSTVVVDGESISKYWIGFEYETSATSSWPITLFTSEVQHLSGDEVIGIPHLVPTTSYSAISTSAENGGSSKYLISNTRTGETELVDIDGTVNTKAISLTSQASSDTYLFQTLEDSGISSPSLVTVQMV